MLEAAEIMVANGWVLIEEVEKTLRFFIYLRVLLRLAAKWETPGDPINFS